MEFRTPGPLEVVRDGPVALPRGRARALLALLTWRAGEIVAAERLIDELWGPTPPPTRPRRSTAWCPHSGGDSSARPGKAAMLRAALGLWRGPALDDLCYEPFAQGAIADIEESQLSALEERIDTDLAVGRHAEVVGELQGLIAEHPLRGRLRAQHMLALYRSGRQADALASYRKTRRRLVDELGVEPSPQLRALEQAILAQRQPARGPDPGAHPSR